MLSASFYIHELTGASDCLAFRREDTVCPSHPDGVTSLAPLDSWTVVASSGFKPAIGERLFRRANDRILDAKPYGLWLSEMQKFETSTLKV